MAMSRKTITIPETMEEWVKAQIACGRYGNDSEYFRDLIRTDQDRASAKNELAALIEEGINSGTSESSIEDIIKHVRKKIGQDDTI